MDTQLYKPKTQHLITLMHNSIQDLCTFTRLFIWNENENESIDSNFFRFHVFTNNCT